MNIGLITYHSAYNFGSVLQAYATQFVLEEIGHNVTIINYRMKSQKKIYGLIQTGSGYKDTLRSLLQLFNYKKRIERQNKFEMFIQSKLNLTKEVNEPDQLEEFKDCFDIYISGSDQIWNKHSNELKNVDWKYMYPYLLQFTDKKKISYASSITNMDTVDLEYIIPYIKKFDYISLREQQSAKVLQRTINQRIEYVLDPTLLISKDEWMDIVEKERIVKERYVLLYSLAGTNGIRDALNYIEKLTDQYGLYVAVIAPMAVVVPRKHRINVSYVGPLDLLNLIYFSDFVITNSYHGSLFSVNFRKDFFFIKAGSSDVRIKDILELLSLKDRYVNISSINSLSKTNWGSSLEVLCDMRKKSIYYLKHSLNSD